MKLLFPNAQSVSVASKEIRSADIIMPNLMYSDYQETVTTYMVEVSSIPGDVECYRDWWPIDVFLNGSKSRVNMLSAIDKLHINNGVTVIIDKDKTKTIVKPQNGERNDKLKGVLMCLLKRELDSARYTEFCNFFRTSNSGLEKAMAFGILWYIHGEELNEFLDKYGIKNTYSQS